MNKKIRSLTVSDIKSLMQGQFFKEALALAILIIIWALFLRDAFTNTGSFTLFMDNEFFLGTVLSSMSATFSHGQWPMRMETLLGGIPLYNFAQISPFYPFYLAVLPIYTTPLQAAHSMHWIEVGHLLLFQTNTYIFLRFLPASRIASIAGACLVAFSLNTLSYSPWMSIIAPYAWLPLFLAGFIGVLQQPSSLKFAAMTLFAIVMLAWASPAQPLIHAVFLSVVLISFYILDGLVRHRSVEYVKVFGVLAGIALVAFLLAAPVIVPVSMGLKDMVRWIGALPPVIGNASIPYSAFEVSQLSLPDLGGVFFVTKPPAVGDQYLGLFLIALALIAVVSRPRWWIVQALAAIALYSLISATGSHFGLLWLNYHIPLLNKIREPTRFLVLFQFSAAILAAIGIDELRKKGPDIGHWSRLNVQMVAAAMCGVAGLAIAIVLGGRTTAHTPPWLTILALFGTIFITYAASKAYKGEKPIVATLWAAAAIISLAADVSWTPLPISDSQYLTGGGPALDQVLTRIVALDPGHKYKVIFRGKIPEQEAAMLASYRGIKVLDMYVNPAPYEQFQQMYDQGQMRGNYFPILGARYLICAECTKDLTQGYTYREKVSGYDIYEDDDSLADFFVRTRVDGVYTDLNDFISKTSGPGFRSGVLYFDQKSAIPNMGHINSPRPANCVVSEVKHTENELRFSLNCSQPGVLVINQFFDRSWESYMDAKPAPTLRVNGNQLGVSFSAGRHQVELRYRPRVFIISLVLMAIGVGAALTVLIVSLVQKIGQTTTTKVRDFVTKAGRR